MKKKSLRRQKVNKYFMYNMKMAIIMAPKHVAVPNVQNTLYSTNKYSCVRPAHTYCTFYFIERNGEGEPHDCVCVCVAFIYSHSSAIRSICVGGGTDWVVGDYFASPEMIF